MINTSWKEKLKPFRISWLWTKTTRWCKPKNWISRKTP